MHKAKNRRACKDVDSWRNTQEKCYFVYNHFFVQRSEAIAMQYAPYESKIGMFTKKPKIVFPAPYNPAYQRYNQGPVAQGRVPMEGEGGVTPHGEIAVGYSV